MSPVAVVTGAFSNTGSAVAALLLERGWTVRTLTNKVPPPGSPVEASPLRFDRAFLRDQLRGADVLVNTYWIRFPHGSVTFDTAVANSRLLFEAAVEAGVRRIVHVSVTNASHDNALAYYRGKARVDEALRSVAESWAIVRPTLVVGPHDVLTNNVAWFLRRAPVFALPSGDGYELQPVLLDDVGALLADACGSDANSDTDAAGPECFTFESYVRELAAAIGLERRFVTMPPPLVLSALRVAGWGLRDTVLTPEELYGLRDNLLVSSGPATCDGSVREWLRANASVFGRSYANDTRTRFTAGR